MPQTPAPETTEISLSRLDDDGRAVLFTNARTANTFSDRPVHEEQLREMYELMKWGPTWANTLPLRILYVTTPEDAEFFPEGDWHSFLVVNIGHPGKDPWFGRQARLNYHEAVRHA
jgi:hypothetical protein